jgi:hypothetical protein
MSEEKYIRIPLRVAEEMLDTARDLKAEWFWMEKEPRKRQEWTELCEGIEELKNWIEVAEDKDDEPPTN